MQEFNGYRVKMYPTKEQEEMLMEYCRVSRFSYNWAYFENQNHYEESGSSLSANELCKRFTEFKNDVTTKYHEWLSKFNVSPMRIAVRNFAGAVSKYIKLHKRFKWYGFPKPKTKKDNSKMFFFTRKERMQVTEHYVSFEGFTFRDNNAIYLGNHNIPYGKNMGNKHTTCNYCDPHIEVDNDGVWWFSCLVKYDKPKRINHNIFREGPIGIDLGVKTFATLSDGTKYDYPKEKIRKYEKRMRRQQRRLAKDHLRRKEQAKKTKTKSRDIPKSKNMLKRESKLRKTYRKISNIKKNERYHIANEIIKKNPRTVVMEGLNVTGMLKNKFLANSIHNAGFYEFRILMQEKCEVNDINFIVADQWFPSSKKCSCCGNIKRDLKLSDRTYRCDACGAVIDRDINAAINLRDLGVIHI